MNSFRPSTEVGLTHWTEWEVSLVGAERTGKYTVTLVPGDGIGNEITDSVKEIFNALKVPVQWEQYDVSGETNAGEETFQEAMESLKRNKVGLKGEWGMITNYKQCKVRKLATSSRMGRPRMEA